MPVQLSAAQNDDVQKRLLTQRLDGNIRDLLRVANRIIAKISDNQAANWKEVLEYGMTGLLESTAASTISKELAKVFVADGHIDSILESVDRIETIVFEEDVRAFLASELRRIATEKKVEPGDLCDVSTRTLRDWASRRPASGNRRKSAAQ